MSNHERLFERMARDSARDRFQAAMGRYGGRTGHRSSEDRLRTGPPGRG